MASPAEPILVGWRRRAVGGVVAVVTSVSLLLAPAAARADEGDPTPPNATTTYLAQIVYPGTLRAGPSDSAVATGSVSPKTKWGGATQLMVQGSERTAGRLWIDVRVQGRPNGNHGWIPADLA
ncbi:MAG: hypothetical protein Q7T55_22080, partial [Solirubrobacteraceae bacterium]|nr:hypothetical protein [Solirubrobacteraceae bacterium]